MMSSIVPVILMSLIYAETSSFNIHSKIYSNLDAKNGVVTNTTDEKAKTENISNLYSNLLRRFDQNKDSNKQKVDNEGKLNGINRFNNNKIYDNPLDNANIGNIEIADEAKTIKVNTKQSINEDRSTQDNTYKNSNWKRRVKRDEDDEEAIMIWDNCPGKLQYAIIDGELKCVNPSEMMGLSDRITESLGKCPKGTRRIILPDRTKMCLKKRSRS